MEPRHQRTATYEPGDRRHLAADWQSVVRKPRRRGRANGTLNATIAGDRFSGSLRIDTASDSPSEGCSGTAANLTGAAGVNGITLTALAHSRSVCGHSDGCRVAPDPLAMDDSGLHRPGATLLPPFLSIRTGRVPHWRSKDRAVTTRQSNCCPRCTSPKTTRKEAPNNIGLTLYECTRCGAQFTLQQQPHGLSGHPDSMRSDK